jgi:hypothetical protein
VQMELAHANRVAMMGQLTAAIAHEINQRIGATITYANAALSWLRAQPPNWERSGRRLDSSWKAAYGQARSSIGAGLS